MTLSVAACAGTEMPDVTPDVDPSLPGVQGSGDPSRATGSDGEGTKIPADSGSGGAKTGSDAGTTKDSGTVVVVDSGSTTGGTPKPAQGEVLITEVMYDPFGTEPDSEWFELHNTAASARSLGGLVISDGGGRTHTIASGTIIDAGEYLVMVRSKTAATTAKIPNVAGTYEYGEGLPSNAGIQLANGSTGGLYLRNGGTVITQADYGGWFSMSGGSSIELKTGSYSYAASGSSSGWCVAASTWTSGSDKGTPGAASDCN